MTAAAQVACTQDVVFYFDENLEVVEEWEGKPVQYVPVTGRPEWRKLNIRKTLEELRRDITAMLVRIGSEEQKH